MGSSFGYAPSSVHGCGGAGTNIAGGTTNRGRAEGAILYYVSTALAVLSVFVPGVIALFMVDILWALVLYLASPEVSTTPTRWAIINGAACLTLLVALALFASSFALPFLLLAILVARAAADYTWNWEFYFPRGEDAHDSRCLTKPGDSGVIVQVEPRSSLRCPPVANW